MKAVLLTAHFLTTSLLWSTCTAWWGQIVFEDNFDGNFLNLDKWEYQEGCSSVYGAENLQCNTRNNIQVTNGFLKITARRQDMEDKKYTSGRIHQKRSGFTYGAYVTRARLARGDHLWPALWMLSIDNDCRYEEIDIAEYRGQASEARSLEMAGRWGQSWDKLTSKGVRGLNQCSMGSSSRFP